MNKSEIAEKAAREIVNEHIDSGACASSKAERKAIERDAIAAIKLRVERAIAESQAPQPSKKGRMAPMDSEGSVWVEPFSKWQRRVLLHGIRTVSAICECHAGERDPLIPHLSELVELSEQHKDYFEFDWDGKQWTGIMPNLNGG